jgi:hypothetical protein
MNENTPPPLSWVQVAYPNFESTTLVVRLRAIIEAQRHRDNLQRRSVINVHITLFGLY